MAKKRKILLIVPPIFNERKRSSKLFPTLAGLIEPAPPLAVAVLAGYLKREAPKWETRVLDGNFSDLNSLAEAIKKFHPSVVGISCSFMNYDNSLLCARISKALGAKVIFGGAYASGAARAILQNRGPGSRDYCVDAVCREDGEEAIKQFVGGAALEKIPNLVWMRAGHPRFNEIKNLNQDDLPFLDFNGIGLPDIRDYYRVQSRVRAIRNKIFGNKLFFLLSKGIYVYSRKGCFWRSLPGGGCVFCSATYSSVLLKSPDRFLDEVLYLKKKYEPNIVYDVSEDFLGNFQWFEKFCQLASGRSLPKFLIYTRFDRINKNTVAMMKECNIAAVAAGFESGSDKILNLMYKGLRLSDCLRGAELLFRNDIGLVASFIFGGPGETRWTLKSSLRLIDFLKRGNRLILPRFSRFTIIPGSQAFEWLVKKTGKKYSGKDYFNQEEAFCDWLKYFTKVNLSDISAAADEANKIIFSS